MLILLVLTVLTLKEIIVVKFKRLKFRFWENWILNVTEAWSEKSLKEKMPVLVCVDFDVGNLFFCFVCLFVCFYLLNIVTGFFWSSRGKMAEDCLHTHW